MVLAICLILLPALSFAVDEMYHGGSYDGYAMNNDVVDSSLPVSLTSFTATACDGKVILHWITESEIENLGFNIYRSTNSNVKFLIINDELIPGAGNSSQRHEYEYVDKGLTNGVTYRYKLEDVDYSGEHRITRSRIRHTD